MNPIHYFPKCFFLFNNLKEKNVIECVTERETVYVTGYSLFCKCIKNVLNEYQLN